MDSALSCVPGAREARQPGPLACARARRTARAWPLRAWFASDAAVSGAAGAVRSGRRASTGCGEVGARPSQRQTHNAALSLSRTRLEHAKGLARRAKVLLNLQRRAGDARSSKHGCILQRCQQLVTPLALG